MKSIAMWFSSHDTMKGPRPNAGLQKLPTDILMCIFDFLDIQDKTCISFCNRFLHDFVNTPAWRERHSDMLSNFDERQSFLLRLVRDYPDHVVCKVCSTIHHMTRLAPLAEVMHKNSKCYPRFPQARAHLEDLGSLDKIDLSYEFRIKRSHVQLAMERHRYGPGHGIPLNLLSIREVEDDSTYKSRWTRMLSVEPKIIADEVHLRVQDLWLLTLGQRDETIIEQVRLKFCRHHHDVAADVLICKLKHLNRLKDCPTCCQYQRCSVCAVEFQADIRTLADGRRIVIVTRLMNLGGGRGERDTTWDLLTCRHSPANALRWRVYEAVIERGSDKIWSFVERQGFRPLSEVTDLNMSTLCSKSYKMYFSRLVWSGCFDYKYRDSHHWVHQNDTDVERFWPGSQSSLHRIGRWYRSICASRYDHGADTDRAQPMSIPKSQKPTEGAWKSLRRIFSIAQELLVTRG